MPNLPAGTYTVLASFVGYKPATQTVKITAQSVVASFRLSSDNASLAEVQVVATQAQERETPVAFSAVNGVKLRETLSNRDLPLILNETPGVYATQGGGGTGDSRINVRGFDQRNVAVLINGVPVYGSRRTSDGWVDKAFDDAWTYFGTVSKRAGHHTLSLTGLGSPQRHGQWSFPAAVGLYSCQKALEIGVPANCLPANGDRGFDYNPYWGTLDRYAIVGGVKVSHG